MRCDKGSWVADLIAILGMLIVVVVPAAATEHRLCIGEYERGCPVSHDLYGYCGESVQLIVARNCTKIVDGKSQSVPFNFTQLGSRDGNKCGYTWFRVECLDDRPH